MPLPKGSCTDDQAQRHTFETYPLFAAHIEDKDLGNLPKEMSPAVGVALDPPMESIDMRTVDPRATPHPNHIFLVGDSPARVASSGVRMLVACIGLPDICSQPQKPLLDKRVLP